MLDSRRAVADDVVEILLQLVDDATHPLALQRVLVARLRGREDIEILQALVADQRLVELGIAVDDVDEVEDDAAFASHDEIEIAQADVEIDDHRFLAALGEAGGESGGGRRLADAALTRGDNNDLCQAIPPHCKPGSVSRYPR